MNLEGHERQNIKDGYGAAYHRVYAVTFPGSLAEAKKALADLQSNPDRFSPHLLASFEKVSGKDGELNAKDEFQVHITGPWNGPVRVEHVSDEEFHLVTLEGHLEAGEIKFRLTELRPGLLLFQIESLARSRDGVVDFFYDKLPIAKMAQTEMWSSFCKKFAEHAARTCRSDAEKISPVSVVTERQDEETGLWKQV
jgi:hypothetical protein